ncbi:MAG TPA: hypothetical protein VLC94_09945 [Candidatus Acidoferrum sp.]|nr:hypothetical protein [Candidatus Acidoferrum sp.]
MVAVMQNSTGRKLRAGKVLLAIGGFSFFLQLWALWLETAPALSQGAETSLGWLGTLGMAMVQMVGFIAWNPHGILLSIARVLLLCWPVAVMAAGVVLSRRTS